MRRFFGWGAVAIVLLVAVVAARSFLEDRTPTVSGFAHRVLPAEESSGAVSIPLVPVPPSPVATVAKPATQSGDRAARAEARVRFVEGEMKEVHKQILREMSNPWAYIYYEPVMKDGRMVGLQFAAPEEREFLRQYGLDLGDVITSINGHDLDGGIGLAQAVTALSQAQNLSLRIRRGDRTFTVQASTHADK